MSYATEPILQDVNGKPIPQAYNTMTNKFESINGTGNAAQYVRAKTYQVGASATTTSIPTLSSSGLSLVLGAASQQRLIGSTFEIVLGTSLAEAVVTAVTSSGTLTLDSPLPSAPTQGAFFTLVPPDPMSLTGSSATLPVKISDGGFTLFTLVNALAITTTTTNFLTYTIPVGMRSARKSLYVDSTLNQSITTLNFIPYLSSGRGPNGDSTAYVGAALPANNNIWIGNKEYSDLDSPFDMVLIEIGCTTAPTSGSVSIYLAGGR